MMPERETTMKRQLLPNGLNPHLRNNQLVGSISPKPPSGVRMQTEETWQAVADERGVLSALLADTDTEAWSRPSPCGDWTVKDVVAHLVVLAEAGNRYGFIARSALIDPRFHKSIDKAARRL